MKPSDGRSTTEQDTGEATEESDTRPNEETVEHDEAGKGALPI